MIQELQKYAETEEVPKYTLKQKQPSKLDPYKDYIRYHSLDDLNGQALAWCRKVNNRVHGTTNKIPARQLAEECLQPMLRESSIVNTNFLFCLFNSAGIISYIDLSLSFLSSSSYCEKSTLYKSTISF